MTGIFLLASSCSRPPHSGQPETYVAYDYVAPVLSMDGAREVGTTEMSYQFEPYISQERYPCSDCILVCWSCTVTNPGSTSFGGNLLFEIRDEDGVDWAVGSARAGSGPRETVRVEGKTTISIGVAKRLRAPHWHLLCGGTDMMMRCGRPIEHGVRGR
jgi:hypothetical protein